MGPMGLTSTYKTFEDCALGKAPKAGVNKKAVAQSKMKGERKYLDVSLPSEASLSSKKHWLLIVADWTDHA